MCAQHTKRFSQMLGMSARVYHLLDAKNETLPGLGWRAAEILKGKNKPHYDPNVDMGDHLVIINTSQVDLRFRKHHRVGWHSRYASGLSFIRETKMNAQYPTLLVKRAVLRHLSKDPLRKERMERLHLYPRGDNPYWEQITHVLPQKSALYRGLEDYTAEEIKNFPILVNPRYTLLLPQHHEAAPELMERWDKWAAEREELIRKYFPRKRVFAEQ